jgi:hypothetical protein
VRAKCPNATLAGLSSVPTCHEPRQWKMTKKKKSCAAAMRR